MQLVMIITGLWFIGIVIAGLVITRKVRKDSYEIRSIRETDIENVEV